MPVPDSPRNVTIGALVRELTGTLSSAGIHTARLDAELLIAQGLGLGRTALLARWEAAVSVDEERSIRGLAARRLAGEPLQYIRGIQEFYGRPFVVTPDVLIPRPETEHLVEAVLEYVSGPKDARGVARTSCSGDSRPDPATNVVGRGFPRDLCSSSATNDVGAGSPGPHPTLADAGTGSGCIAITLALELPGAILYATDISRAALHVARHNAERLCIHRKGGDHARNPAASVETGRPVPSGFRDLSPFFVHSDLLTCFPPASLDVVVSNPPYVAEQDRASLPPGVRNHEPSLALFSGAGGLATIRRLIHQSARALRPEGLCFLEIGPGQSRSLEGLAAQAGLHILEIRPDLAGIPRIAILHRPR